MSAVGRPLDRVDGPPKVTGQARYAADFPAKDLVHAVAVSSRIAYGRVRRFGTEEVLKAPGVMAVITHRNAPRLHPPPDDGAADETDTGVPGERWLPLQDQSVHYGGQPVALVVADTWERACNAAARLQVEYEELVPDIDIHEHIAKGYPAPGQGLQARRGDFAAAIAGANVQMDQTYSTPVEHHNPMEPAATIAVWDADDQELTLFDSTQAVMGTQHLVAQRLGLPRHKVRVVSHFVGGGFGCKGFVWHQPVLAAMAARITGRPVKLALTRAQMFTGTGHRPQTLQRLRLGAGRDGMLTALQHITTAHTSKVDEYVETCGLVSRVLYACPNVDIQHHIVPLHTGTPTPMRAPGVAPGLFALECAMDELAYALHVDPLQLRILNHADTHPHVRRPWSSKHLLECYRRGAKLFGWSRRPPETGALREGNDRIGYGMATATFPAYRSPAAARVRLFADGHAVVASATQELGTGSYTIFTQIAADALGLPVEKIRFELGDSRLPPAPISGGSQTAASVGPAVRAAAEAMRKRVAHMAVEDRASPLHGLSIGEIDAADGRLFARGNPSQSDTYADILHRARAPEIEEMRAVDNDDAKGQCAFQSFGAHFVEVRVDRELGRVRVARCVSVFDVGRVLNAKTARSQMQGGVVMGIGMALMERTVFDPRQGLVLNDNLGDYLVPVNADVPDIHVEFIDQPDPHFNVLGARGIGEIGITGVAPAIANAVYHATGRRIRDLPITPDKLL